MSNSDGSRSVLSAVPLFANLSQEVLDELAGTARLRKYPPGQILCNEGDPGDDLILLETGQIRVSRFTPDGNEVVLSVMHAPAALGELALLDGAPRDATVTAQSAIVVRLIPRGVFLQVLDREPAVVRGLLRSLAAMVRAGNARHADFVGLDVPGRLAKWLLTQAAQPAGSDATSGTVVQMHGSQGELAAELGTTRSTLNRALREFESLGFITVNNNQVTLQKPDDLSTYTW